MSARGQKVTVRFGPLLDFEGRSDDMSSMRAITDEIMAAIQSLSGQEYTGKYAPRGATPTAEAA